MAIDNRAAPLRFAARMVEGSWIVDLVRADGRVFWPQFGSGPDEVLAILASEQRYLVEQVGSGSFRGDTYVDKVRERLRRGPVADLEV